MREHRWPRILLSLGIVVAACTVYAHAAFNGFAFDDTPLILQNRLIASPAGIPELFARDFWEPYGRAGLYRPLVTTAYALQREAFGLAPGGFHVVSIALHAAVSALVFLILSRLLADLWVAGATGLLFAVHAVHSEVAATITTGQPELMAAFWAMLALLLHLLADDAAGRRESWGLRSASLVCYALALLSKEGAITLVGLVLFVDWWRRDGVGLPSPRRVGAMLRARWGTYLLWGAVTAAYLGVRVAILGSLASGRTPGFLANPLAYVDPVWRIATAGWVLLRYLALFLWPADLSHDYSYDHIPVLQSTGDPRLLAVAALVVAATALTVWCMRHSRPGVLALGLFAIPFSVVSNVPFAITAIMAERVLYLPLLGLCLGLALAARAAVRGLGRETARHAAFAAILGAVIVPNGVRTFERSQDWRSDWTIRRSDVTRHPRNAKLQINAGMSLLEQGRPEEALAHFDTAVAIVADPGRSSAAFRGRIWALVGVGRLEEARALYDQVRPHIRDPRLEATLAGTGGDATRAPPAPPPR